MWTALLDPDRLRASLPDQPLPYAAAQERLTGGAVGAGAGLLGVVSAGAVDINAPLGRILVRDGRLRQPFLSL